MEQELRLEVEEVIDLISIVWLKLGSIDRGLRVIRADLIRYVAATFGHLAVLLKDELTERCIF